MSGGYWALVVVIAAVVIAAGVWLFFPMRNHVELEVLGWDVHVLEGMDHMQAMMSTNVLPILRPWVEDRFARVGGDR